MGSTGTLCRFSVTQIRAPMRSRLMFSVGHHGHADVAQLVAHNLAKVGVAGSNPVVRSQVPTGMQ